MRAATPDIVLAMRPVPHKILDAYRQPASRVVRERVVDHKPSCRYDALLAEQNAAAFRCTFRARGPEVGDVRVEKRKAGP